MFIFIQIKAILIIFLALIFALLPAGIMAIPFRLGTRLKIVGPGWNIFSKIVLRYACHAHIQISEDYRSQEYQTNPSFGLYVVNHQSFADIPLVATIYQVPPIMKKEILFIPFIGWMAWISGALPLSRSKQGSRLKVFEQARQRITQQKIGLQVYPEGTRSLDGLPKPYSGVKKSLLIFAYKEKIPVIPTSLYGTRELIKPNGIINTGKSLGIIVHKEILPQDYATSEEFCAACWGKVIEGHNLMMEKLRPLNESLS